MKRRDLIRRLTETGCVLTRHGGNHDWYTNHTTKVSQAVPRHKEINEITLKKYSVSSLARNNNEDHCSNEASRQ